MAPSGNDMKQEEKVACLTMAVKQALANSIAARNQSTGTLTITVEVNLSQGGIGQSYLSDNFRRQVGK